MAYLSTGNFLGGSPPARGGGTKIGKNRKKSRKIPPVLTYGQWPCLKVIFKNIVTVCNAELSGWD